MEYATLLRQAFAFHAGSAAAGAADLASGRAQDPAGLADPSLCTPEQLERAKVGAGYAMEIFLAAVRRDRAELEEAERARLASFVPRVVGATDPDQLAALIREFDESVLARYFLANRGGWLSLKSA